MQQFESLKILQTITAIFTALLGCYSIVAFSCFLMFMCSCGFQFFRIQFSRLLRFAPIVDVHRKLLEGWHFVQQKFIYQWVKVFLFLLYQTFRLVPLAIKSHFPGHRHWQRFFAEFKKMLTKFYIGCLRFFYNIICVVERLFYLPFIWPSFYFRLQLTWSYAYFVLHFYALKVLDSLILFSRRLHDVTAAVTSPKARIVSFVENWKFILKGFFRFLGATGFVRLEDVHFPPLLEQGYPTTWSDSSLLYQQMYVHDAFDLWTHRREYDKLIFNQIKEHFVLPLYLERTETRLPPEEIRPFLDQLRDSLIQNHGVPAGRVYDNLINELYQLFSDSLRLTILEELQRDPLILLRLCAADYKNMLSMTNPFNTYMFDSGILERVFSHWRLLHQQNFSENIVMVTQQKAERFFFPSGNSLNTYFELLSKRGYSQFWHADWEILVSEIYIETFLVALPYEFFWGKAFILHGMILPFWALWAKPFIATPPCAFLIIYVTVFYFYLKYALQLVSLDLQYMYSQGWWEFRYSCIFYLGLDPDDEDGNEIIFWLVIWFFIPLYYDRVRLPYLTKSQPEYHKGLVQINRGRHVGSYDYVLDRFADQLSPVLFLRYYHSQGGFRYPFALWGLPNKATNDRLQFLNPYMQYLESTWLYSYLSIMGATYDETGVNGEAVNNFVEDWNEALTQTEEILLNKELRHRKRLSKLTVERFAFPRLAPWCRNPYFLPGWPLQGGKSSRDPRPLKWTRPFPYWSKLPAYSNFVTAENRVIVPLLEKNVEFKSKLPPLNYRWRTFWDRLVNLDYTVLAVPLRAQEQGFSKKYYQPLLRARFYKLFTESEWTYVTDQLSRNIEFENLFLRRDFLFRSIFFREPFALKLKHTQYFFPCSDESEVNIFRQIFDPKIADEMNIHADTTIGPTRNFYLNDIRSFLQHEALVDYTKTSNDFFEPMDEDFMRPVEDDGRDPLYYSQHRQELDGSRHKHPINITEQLVFRRWVKTLQAHDAPTITDSLRLQNWLLRFEDVDEIRDWGQVSYDHHDMLRRRETKLSLRMSGIPANRLRTLWHDELRVYLQQGDPKVLAWRAANRDKMTARERLVFALSRNYLAFYHGNGPALPDFVLRTPLVSYSVNKVDDNEMLADRKLERPPVELRTHLEVQQAIEFMKYGFMSEASVQRDTLVSREAYWLFIPVPLRLKKGKSCNDVRYLVSTVDELPVQRDEFVDYYHQLVFAFQNQTKVPPFVFTDEENDYIDLLNLLRHRLDERLVRWQVSDETGLPLMLSIPDLLQLNSEVKQVQKDLLVQPEVASTPVVQKLPKKNSAFPFGIEPPELVVPKPVEPKDESLLTEEEKKEEEKRKKLEEEETLVRQDIEYIWSRFFYKRMRFFDVMPKILNGLLQRDPSTGMLFHYRTYYTKDDYRKLVHSGNYWPSVLYDPVLTPEDWGFYTFPFTSSYLNFRRQTSSSVPPIDVGVIPIIPLAGDIVYQPFQWHLLQKEAFRRYLSRLYTRASELQTFVGSNTRRPMKHDEARLLSEFFHMLFISPEELRDLKAKIGLAEKPELRLYPNGDHMLLQTEFYEEEEIDDLYTIKPITTTTAGPIVEPIRDDFRQPIDRLALRYRHLYRQQRFTLAYDTYQALEAIVRLTGATGTRKHMVEHPRAPYGEKLLYRGTERQRDLFFIDLALLNFDEHWQEREQILPVSFLFNAVDWFLSDQRYDYLPRTLGKALQDFIWGINEETGAFFDRQELRKFMEAYPVALEDFSLKPGVTAVPNWEDILEDLTVNPWTQDYTSSLNLAIWSRMDRMQEQVTANNLVQQLPSHLSVQNYCETVYFPPLQIELFSDFLIECRKYRLSRDDDFIGRPPAKQYCITEVMTIDNYDHPYHIYQELVQMGVREPRKGPLGRLQKISAYSQWKSWDSGRVFHNRLRITLYDDLYYNDEEHIFALDESLSYADPRFDDHDEPQIVEVDDYAEADEDIFWEIWMTEYTWRGDFSMRDVKDQALLVGVYQATQLMSDDYVKLLQLSSLYNTPWDLYGLYVENSLGYSPFSWFDVYDPLHQTVVEVAPHLEFEFKDGLFLQRGVGYKRSSNHLSNVSSEFAIVDNLEVVATGFSDLEKAAGLEFAAFYYTQTYLGMSPGQLLESFVYTSYWTTNWFHALYHVFFFDVLPYEQVDILRTGEPAKQRAGEVVDPNLIKENPFIFLEAKKDNDVDFQTQMALLKDQKRFFRRAIFYLDLVDSAAYPYAVDATVSPFGAEVDPWKTFYPYILGEKFTIEEADFTSLAQYSDLTGDVNKGFFLRRDMQNGTLFVCDPSGNPIRFGPAGLEQRLAVNPKGHYDLEHLFGSTLATSIDSDGRAIIATEDRPLVVWISGRPYMLTLQDNQKLVLVQPALGAAYVPLESRLESRPPVIYNPEVRLVEMGDGNVIKIVGLPKGTSQAIQPIFLGFGITPDTERLRREPRGDRPIVILGPEARIVSVIGNDNHPVLIGEQTQTVSVNNREWSIAELHQMAKLIQKDGSNVNRSSPAVVPDNRPIAFGSDMADAPQMRVESIASFNPLYVDLQGRRIRTGDWDDDYQIFMDGNNPQLIDRTGKDVRQGRPVILVNDLYEPLMVFGLGPELRKVWLRPGTDVVIVNNKLVDVDSLGEPLWENLLLRNHPFVLTAQQRSSQFETAEAFWDRTLSTNPEIHELERRFSEARLKEKYSKPHKEVWES